MRQAEKPDPTSLRRARHGGDTLSGSTAELILIERVTHIGSDRSEESCGSADTASDASEPGNKHCLSRSTEGDGRLQAPADRPPR
jgi:hypothetical protein